jgi:hypothetical protein
MASSTKTIVLITGGMFNENTLIRKFMLTEFRYSE